MSHGKDSGAFDLDGLFAAEDDPDGKRLERIHGMGHMLASEVEQVLVESFGIAFKSQFSNVLRSEPNPDAGAKASCVSNQRRRPKCLREHAIHWRLVVARLFLQESLDAINDELEVLTDGSAVSQLLSRRKVVAHDDRILCPLLRRLLIAHNLFLPDRVGTAGWAVHQTCNSA